MELEAVFERLAAAVDRLRAEETSTGVLGRLAPEARRLAGADLAAVLLRAEPSRGWAPVSWDPNGAAGSTPISGATRFPSAPGTLVEAVLRSKQAIWEASLAGAGADDRDLGAALGLGSVALLPVHCEGVICAILALGWGAPGHAPAPGSEPGSPPVLVPGLAEALAGYAGMAIENAALRGELEHGGLRAELSARAEGSEALHRVAADVAGRSDPEEIADDALGALLGLYQADAGVFNLLDEGSRISSFVHAGLSEEELLQLTAIFSEGRGGRGRDVQTQVFQLTATERRRPLRRFFAEHGFASLVRVSAVSQGRVIGRLILLHREVRQYRLDELAQLEAFAVQLAGGLRLAKAYSDLES
ncbi:MAG: GAF domain-containing protein, partial [Candidatus Dormibacteraceae bacterium]